MGSFYRDNGKYWAACFEHKTVFQGNRCPYDPCIAEQDLVLDNCNVASCDWKKKTTAERWLNTVEVLDILDESDLIIFNKKVLF